MPLINGTNTFTGTSNTFNNTFTLIGGLTASATQTINFGTNAPTMSGANVSSLNASNLTTGAISSTIITNSGIATTSSLSSYLTTSSAASTYLSQTSASSTYAPLASPTLTGTPLAPTATTGTNNTQIATTAFVQNSLSGVNLTNLVDLTSAQTITGTKTFNSIIPSPKYDTNSINIGSSPYATLNSYTNPGYNVIIGNGNITNTTSTNTLQNNIILGYNVAANATNMLDCVGIGRTSLLSLTSGSNNTSVGTSCMAALTTGNNNSAFGAEIMSYTNTGQYSLPSNMSDNVCLGYRSLQNVGQLGGISPNSNTAIGNFALNADNGGYGTNCLYGSNNSALGYKSGTRISQGSNNNTLIGAFADAYLATQSYQYSTALGSGAIITASNQIVLGTATETVYMLNNVNIGYSTSHATTSGYSLDISGNVIATSYNATSDRRLKDNIESLDSQWSNILSITPVSFNWKESKRADTGFIAQDIHTKYPELKPDYSGVQDPESSVEEPVDLSGNPLYYAMDYGRMTPFLWKGLQETMREIDSLKAENEQLKYLIHGLSQRISSLEYR